MARSVIELPPTAPDGVFRALSDPTRRALFHLLTVEELNVSELVRILGQPQSTISRQLKILRDAELVHDRRDGTISWYSAPADRSESADGRRVGLASLVHDWIKGQALPPPLAERLRQMIRRRDGGSSFFNRLGKRWDELRSAAFGKAFAAESFLCLLPGNWTVADIGTGTGYLLPLLARQFEQVIAVEPAEAMLACARQRVADHGLSNVSFHQGGLGEVPLPAQTCDLALAMLVLHHVEAPAKALCELHRIVRPGGRVLIVEQEAHESQAFYERMQDLWWGFPPEELARQLSEAGFHDVRHHRLSTISDERAADAPGLFTLTGQRANRRR